MITRFDMDAIYLDAEPEATMAFVRISADHGKVFAEDLRERILAQKILDWNDVTVANITQAQEK